MSNRLFGVNNPVTHCERRKVRRTWGATVLTLLTLLGLAALCGWMISLIKRTSNIELPTLNIELGTVLAMAPWTQGSILGLLAVLMVLAVWAAVRKVRADDAFYASLRREEDVFAPLREAGRAVPPEDAQRILVACAAEGREIQRLVKSALRTLSVDDYEDALNVAHDRLTTLVACVEALCGRLAAQEPTPQIFPPVVPAPDLAKPSQDGAAQAATDTGAAGGKVSELGSGEPSYAELAQVIVEARNYMSGAASWDDAGRINRLLCEAAARLEGGRAA